MDSSGNGRHGSLKTEGGWPSWGPGHLRFGASDDNVGCVEVASFPNVNGSMSVHARFRVAPELTRPHLGAIVTKWDPFSPNCSWGLNAVIPDCFVYWEGDWRPHRDDLAGARSASNAFRPGQWHTAVAVFVEGKANELYLDGKLVARTPHSQTSLRSTRSPLRIGNRHWLGSDWNPFVGDIDYVRIYRGVVLGMDTRLIPSDVPPIEDQRSALRQMKMTVVLPAYCDSPDRPTPFKCEAGPRTVPFVVELRDEQGSKLTGAKVTVKVNGAGVSPPSFGLVDQGAPDRWDLWADDGIYANANSLNSPGEVGVEFTAEKDGYKIAKRTLSGKATQPEPPWGNVTLAMLHMRLSEGASPEPESGTSRWDLAHSATEYYTRNTAGGITLGFTQYPSGDSWLALAHTQADYTKIADRCHTVAWELVCMDAVITASSEKESKLPMGAGLRGIHGVVVRSNFPSGTPVANRQSNLAHLPPGRRTLGLLVHEVGHLLGLDDTYYRASTGLQTLWKTVTGRDLNLGNWDVEGMNNRWDLMAFGHTLAGGGWIASRPRLAVEDSIRSNWKDRRCWFAGASGQPLRLGEATQTIGFLEESPRMPVRCYPSYDPAKPFFILECRRRSESAEVFTSLAKSAREGNRYPPGMGLSTWLLEPAERWVWGASLADTWDHSEAALVVYLCLPASETSAPERYRAPEMVYGAIPCTDTSEHSVKFGDLGFSVRVVGVTSKGLEVVAK